MIGRPRRRPRCHGVRLRTLVLGLAAAAAACSPRGTDTAAPPRLVVVIVVDQMCAHHLTRFQDLYTGGLHRLFDGGTVFTNARHDHALTYTSPGHATISTGCYPSHHGIVANEWYDRTNGFALTYSARDETSPTLGQSDRPGVSPRRMLRETVGDWLETQSPASHVYAVALKDYAAAMMGGRHPDGVFWYDEDDGTYRTATYYLDAYPAWVREFNDARPADDYRDSVWTQSMPEAAYARSRPDSFAAEADGEHTTFPYPVAAAAEYEGETFYEFLRNTPFADELTLRFAAALAAGEGLGVDDTPDLLFVGCSAADFIGHGWGPYSREAEDYYLRLDRYLDTFMKMLDERVGQGNYTIVLTSDHGAAPLPESLAGKFEGAKRIGWETYDADLDKACGLLARELGIDGPVLAHRSQGLIVDPAAISQSGVPAPELRGRLAALIEDLPYVETVFTYDELAGGVDSPPDSAGGRRRELRRLYRHSFYPDRSPDLFVVFCEHCLVTSSAHGTTHGSPYDYDRRVPLVFWGLGAGRGFVEREVPTVDIAPMVARLLGIEVPDDVDGRALPLEPASAAAAGGGTD